MDLCTLLGCDMVTFYKVKCGLNLILQGKRMVLIELLITANVQVMIQSWSVSGAACPIGGTNGNVI